MICLPSVKRSVDSRSRAHSLEQSPSPHYNPRINVFANANWIRPQGMRMDSSIRLVCCAMPFGYGPTGKLLAIARRLVQRNVSLAFVGHGIAYELAARSAGIFDSLWDCQADESRVRDLIRSSNGMLSIMDREFAPLAVEAGKSLYVVDSLLWMRPTVPPEFRRATVYWAQRFVGRAATFDGCSLRPTEVGPIVAGELQPPQPNGNRLIVNLGGCEASPDRRLEQAYAEFVVHGLIRARDAVSYVKPILVIAGGRCTSRLRSKFAAASIDFMSLSHDESMQCCRSAAIVLTSPGLTTTLERFQSGTPTYFLPPQNYSQWCILRHLRDRELAPHSLHWEDTQTTKLADRLPESVRNPLVRQAILDGVSARWTVDAFQRSLTKILRSDSKRAALAARQRSFFQSLGDNGADTIASQLAGALRATQVDKRAGSLGATAQDSSLSVSRRTQHASG